MERGDNMIGDKNLALQVKKRYGFQALSNSLDDRTAREYQLRDALAAIARKSGVISHDTGMGKTTTATVIMRLLKNEDSRRKFLFIGRARQKSTTPRELADATGMVVQSFSTTQRDIKRMLIGDFYNADIVFITHEALNEHFMMEALFQHIGEFCCVIADEAHLLSNYREASSAWMFNSICRRVEYRFGLTATPMTRLVSQISDLFYALDWETFDDPNVFKNRILNGKENIALDYQDFYHPFEREDLGLGNSYVPSILQVEPTEEQKGSTGKIMMDLTRGEGATPQHKATAERVQEEVDLGGQGLLYVYHHKYRDALVQYLDSRDDITFRYECINGNTSEKEYVRIMDAFHKKEIDVILTSISTHMNLDCEFIFFYEWDINVRQTVGRAERSLLPKEIKCIFLFTDDTGEYLKFMNTVWVRASMIEETLKKDYEFIILIGLTFIKAGIVDEWEINWDNI